MAPGVCASTVRRCARESCNINRRQTRRSRESCNINRRQTRRARSFPSFAVTVSILEQSNNRVYSAGAWGTGFLNENLSLGIVFGGVGSAAGAATPSAGAGAAGGPGRSTRKNADEKSE